MRLVELQAIYESGQSLYGVEREKSSDTADSMEIVKPRTRNKKELPPSFWKWFGNSKVKDKSGNPIIVYHGTRRSGFSHFSDQKRGSQSGHRRNDVQFHFTDHPERAEAYSQPYVPVTKEITHKVPGGEVTTSRFTGETPGTYAVFLRIENPLYVNFDHKDYGDVFAQEFKKAKRSGNDGLIVNYVDDSLDQVSTEFIVFSPEQIKSAMGNKGSYSPERQGIHEGKAFDLLYPKG